MKHAIYALCSGVIAALALQPLNFTPAIFIGLSLFWIIITHLSRPRDFYITGFSFGMGYFVTGLWWIGNALLVGGNPYLWAYPFAVIGVPLIMSIYPMIACGLFAHITQKFNLNRTALPAFAIFCATMGIMEWVRSHALSGFPWNLYGMVWANWLPVAQSAAFIGMYGLTFITIIAGTWAGFLWRSDEPHRIKTILTAVIILSAIGLTTAGTYRLHTHETQYDYSTIVRIITPNIPQDKKWNPILYSENFVKTLDAMNKNFGAPSIQSHTEIIQTNEHKNQKPNRILILPETAFLYSILDDPSALTGLRSVLNGYKDSNTYLFTGFLGFDGTAYSNDLTAFDNNMIQRANFEKSHLVPFGEYIPFQKYIPIGPITKFEGLKKGTGLTTWHIDSIPAVSPLVCYEIIFPNKVRLKETNKANQAKWIVNATNDAWYGISPGPYQHLAIARMRAIEEGVPVIRSANTGISAIIDPYGRILAESDLFKADANETYLPKPAETLGFW